MPRLSGIIVALVVLAPSWFAGDANAGDASPDTVPYVLCRGDRFERVSGDVARPIFLRGVNLGAGLPGHYPGEFAFTREDYRRYLRFARELHANAIRVYALHPPDFYQALREENEAHPGEPLWLFQGIWTELPASNDFWEDGFADAYEREIRLTVDAVHGNAELAPRPGHASGCYASDVSPWLAGWILGREWEPDAVRETQARNPDSTRYRGTCFAVEYGTAMETWLGRVCDALATHERSRYGLARAVSFVNWPTLDVMPHPTETAHGGSDSLPHEDSYSVDPACIRPLGEPGLDSGFLGTFATCHVYPYYPDFMNLDPGYRSHVDRHGACSYAGYLADLKSHAGGLPLLIGEYGVSTSRGISHLQPQGLHDGGASEDEQGARDVRLLEDIVDAGCAGSLLFALFDEWFKESWIVLKTERRRDRDALWHDLLDDEEGYGLIGFDPPGRIRIDGDISDWQGVPPYAEARRGSRPGRARGPATAPPAGGLRAPGRRGGPLLRALYAASDAARFYLRLDLDPEALSGRARAFGVALDVLDPRRGDTRLPAPLDATWSRGAEFILVVDPGRDGQDAEARAELFVDRQMNWSEYSRLPDGPSFIPNPAPLRTAANDDGRFAPMLVETNRERRSDAGVVYPARYLDSGRLARGREPPPEISLAGDTIQAYDPHAEWWLDRATGVLEVSLPWGLLGVGDPSARAVVDDLAGTAEIECAVTHGIGLLAWATGVPGFVADSLGPARGDGRRALRKECQFLGAPGTRQVVEREHVHVISPDSASYSWDGWERPITLPRVKRSAAHIREAFEELESREPHARREFNAFRQGRPPRARPRAAGRRSGPGRRAAVARRARPGPAGPARSRRGAAAR